MIPAAPPGVSERGGGLLYLTVFTYDTGRVDSRGSAWPTALSSSPGMEGGGQGPPPTDTFVLSWWGTPSPLPPCGLGLHIHKPRNSPKKKKNLEQNKTRKTKRGTTKRRKKIRVKKQGWGCGLVQAPSTLTLAMHSTKAFWGWGVLRGQVGREGCNPQRGKQG